MTREEVRSAIIKFVVDNFLFDGEFKLADNESLQDNGVIDSAGVLSLIVFLEERFAISIGENEVRPQNLDTLSSLIEFVLRKQAEAA